MIGTVTLKEILRNNASQLRTSIPSCTVPSCMSTKLEAFLEEMQYALFVKLKSVQAEVWQLGLALTCCRKYAREEGLWGNYP